jgi:FMN phosphatase YigB (HAD superfamily)
MFGDFEICHSLTIAKGAHASALHNNWQECMPIKITFDEQSGIVDEIQEVLEEAIMNGMIKALIFDADGPLYFRTSDVTRKKRALLADFGYSGELQQFEAAYEQEKFKGYVRAETAEEMFRNILESIELAVSVKEAASFTKQFNDIQRQVTATPEAVATLKQLKDEGYKICVLTDSFFSSEEKKRWFVDLGLDAYLDGVVSSFDIHMLKDTPGAYQACLEVLETTASETVFVGHQEYEMVGARASGVTSISVTPIATPNIHSDYAVGSLSELPELLKKVNSLIR